jgi:hypothetical protein
MGAVYEAFDIERRVAVALKRMLHFSADALYRFKKEFRALADVRHTNLVRLHELVASDADVLFFVMELVCGTDFQTYVRGSASPEGAWAPDLERLRVTLRQLARGVHAVHGAGKLHRDIKPSNVLVTGESRVVVLDFGLATELGPSTGAGPLESEQVGTAIYMAPEQALEEPPSPANDWYSVGVMLYEALVGSPPFVGSRFAVINEKCTIDALPPSARATGVPEDLDALCSALLRRDPALRPSGAEVIRLLGGAPDSAHSGTIASAVTVDVARTPLLGRDHELKALREAFDKVCAGHSITVRLSGPSGTGKSAVARHFVDELVESGEAVVLRGRAYERESVPYKAFDQVVDALSRQLIYLQEAGEPLELPQDMGPLAHVFPVLSRVSGVSGEVDKAIAPQAVRRRAFAALRALLGALAQRYPLIVYIDDAQWGDIDSVALLLEVVRSPDAPPLLLLLTCRDEEAATSPFLVAMNERWPSAAEMLGLTVGPLQVEDAQRLALSIIDGPDQFAQRIARAAARESKGNPFLIEELVRGNQTLSAGTDQTLTVLTLGQTVADRLQRLGDEGRRLAEVVAVAGRPLAVSTLADACGQPIPIEEQVDQLVTERLVRVGFREGQEVLEPSHDRIRETIVQQLSAGTLRDRHARLARALERTPGADLEAIALHFLGSGDDSRDRAADYAERAAEAAMNKLAFAQAARMFELALDTTSASPEQVRRLRSRLALVLEWSGRGEEAARAYLSAAEGAPALERAELERAASIELLASGRMTEGAQVLHRVLAAVGLHAPASAIGARLSLIVYRLHLALLALFGFPHRERKPDQISRLDRARTDAVFSAAMGFAYSDVVLGQSMGVRALLMALRSGDRIQVLRATLSEAAARASLGGKRRKTERTLLDFAERLVQKDGMLPAMGFLQGSVGVATYLRGEWKKALETLDTATARTQIHDHRAGWQTTAKVFACWSLNFLGEHRELARRHAALLADAEQRGDKYTSVQLRDGSLAILWLVADDPDGARRNAEEAIASWPRDRYLLQHWHMLYGEGEIELYLGDGAKGYARIKRDERALKKSFLLNVQHMRVQTAFLRGRCAIASLDAERSVRTERLVEVRRLAHRLKREGMSWSAPFAAILTAGAAQAEKNAPRAMASLRTAVELAEAADMKGYATAVRYQLGLLLGGDEGRALRTTAEEGLTAQGIRNPARFAATLVPGHWV